MTLESSMDIQLTQDKAGRHHSESLMTHHGLDRRGFDEMASQPSGKVENLWGDKVGRWSLAASDAWMDEHAQMLSVKNTTAEERAA